MKEITFKQPENKEELMEAFSMNEQVCVYDATSKREIYGFIVSIQRANEMHCFDLTVKRHWVHGVLSSRRRNIVVHWKPAQMLEADEGETDSVEAEA